jgi:hypothetical protein
MTDRQRAYPILSKLKSDGYIAGYIAAQHPISRRWGFKVTLPDETLFYFLPREAIAFAEGIRAGWLDGYGSGRDDEAQAAPLDPRVTADR